MELASKITDKNCKRKQSKLSGKKKVKKKKIEVLNSKQSDSKVKDIGAKVWRNRRPGAVKLKHTDAAYSSSSDSESSSGSHTGSSSDAISSKESEMEEIDVEFEACQPIEADFHGIKQLLNQIFLTAHINQSELAELILAQSDLGSVIKVVDDEDDGVYGITTLISMDKHKDKECLTTMKKFVCSKCKKRASEKYQEFANILKNRKVGLLISDRFVNMPPQIALPLHSSLRSEVEKAAKEDDSYNVEYYLYFAKSLKPCSDDSSIDTGEASNPTFTRKKKKKKRKKQDADAKSDELLFVNLEDELFYKASNVFFSYSVTEVTGLAVGGDWQSDDTYLQTYRTIMLIHQSKLKDIMNEMNALLGT